MSASRHHRDVLTAALLFIGFIGWIAGLVNALPDPGFAGHFAAVFAAALLSAVVGCRTLAGLGVGEVAIAAAVTVLIVIGVATEMREAPVEPLRFAAIPVAVVGAIAGMWRRPRAPSPRSTWLTLAAGAAGFGVTFLAVGVAMLVDADAAEVGVLPGAAAGAIASTLLFEHARARHAAIGQALVYATALVAQEVSLETLGGGLAIGLLAGGLGGWLGCVLRARLASRRGLPTARVEERDRV